MDAVVKEVVVGAQKTLSPFPHPEPEQIEIGFIEKVLAYCVDEGVEDLILMTGEPWSIIWSDRIVKVGKRAVTHGELESLLQMMTSNTNAPIDLARAEPIDFNYVLRVGRGKSIRFRAVATGCLGPNGRVGMEIVIRPTGKSIASMDDLNVPQYIRDHCMPKTGIVLITGPTGSGKSTLLDSILRAQLTSEMARHVVTFFAPIETDLQNIPNRTGIVAQCEIGTRGYGAHLTSFPNAVRNFLRRHPHVVVFGEARDHETIDGAVFASQTGHATYTTTHTSNVHMAIPRMADVFSGSDRVRVMNALIDNTRLIVHQRLVKKPNGIGRTPIISALAINNDMKSELLRTNHDQVAKIIMRMTKEHGIDLWEDAQQKHAQGLIHDDEMVSLRSELSSEGAL